MVFDGLRLENLIRILCLIVGKNHKLICLKRTKQFFFLVKTLEISICLLD